MYGKMRSLGSLRSYAPQLSRASILCLFLLSLLRVHHRGRGWRQRLNAWLEGALGPLGLTSIRAAVMWGLDGCNTLCLLIWRAAFLAHSFPKAQLLRSYLSLPSCCIFASSWEYWTHYPYMHLKYLCLHVYISFLQRRVELMQEDCDVTICPALSGVPGTSTQVPCTSPPRASPQALEPHPGPCIYCIFYIYTLLYCGF